MLEETGLHDEAWPVGLEAVAYTAARTNQIAVLPYMLGRSPNFLLLLRLTIGIRPNYSYQIIGKDEYFLDQTLSEYQHTILTLNPPVVAGQLSEPYSANTFTAETLEKPMFDLSCMILPTVFAEYRRCLFKCKYKGKTKARIRAGRRRPLACALL